MDLDSLSVAPESPDVMMGPTLHKKVLITNPNGLHLRPAAAFARLALKYQCAVFIIKDDVRVDGKSPLEILTLAAEAGTELIIEASGADASDALTALVEVINAPLEEPPSEPPRNGK